MSLAIHTVQRCCCLCRMQCLVCERPAAEVCTGCESAVYCGAECQRVDFAEHARICAGCLVGGPLEQWKQLERKPGSETPKFAYFFTNIVIHLTRRLYAEAAGQKVKAFPLDTLQAFAESLISIAEATKLDKQRDMGEHNRGAKGLLPSLPEQLRKATLEGTLDQTVRKTIYTLLADIADARNRLKVFQETYGKSWNVFKSSLEKFELQLKGKQRTRARFRSSLERDPEMLRSAIDVVSKAEQMGMYIDWLLLT